MSLASTNIQRQAQAILNLHSVIETEEYKKIVKFVSYQASARYRSRVLMAGVGKNANIASKIAETMASLGIPAMPLNVSHMGHGDFGYIGPEDMIIHISRSGTTREMLIAMEHVKAIRPQVLQVLIHCKPNKPSNKWADIELFIGAVEEGDEFGLAPTTSTTALLCILDCISVEASHNSGFKKMDFLKFHPDGALGEMLKKEEAHEASMLVELVTHQRAMFQEFAQAQLETLAAPELEDVVQQIHALPRAEESAKPVPAYIPEEPIRRSSFGDFGLTEAEILAADQLASRRI